MFEFIDLAFILDSVHPLQMPEHAFFVLGWYEQDGNQASFKPMSERGSGGGDGLSGSGSNVKTIGEVKSLQIGLNSDKGEYYSTLATTVMFQKDKAMYQSCTQSGSDGKGCNKKVCKYLLKRTHIKLS